MASPGFSREERLAIEGELVVEVDLGDAGEEDRVSVGGYDLHDLIVSQFCDAGDRVQRLGRFRVVIERVD